MRYPTIDVVSNIVLVLLVVTTVDHCNLEHRSVLQTTCGCWRDRRAPIVIRSLDRGGHCLTRCRHTQHVRVVGGESICSTRIRIPSDHPVRVLEVAVLKRVVVMAPLILADVPIRHLEGLDRSSCSCYVPILKFLHKLHATICCIVSIGNAAFACARIVRAINPGLDQVKP